MVSMRALIIGLVASFTFAGCGVPQGEHDQLKTENATLTAENARLQRQVDELLHGEARTIGEVERSYEAKNYEQTKGLIRRLRHQHPESPKNKEYVALEAEIDKVLEARRIEREAKDKEQKRLANLNNLGMWSVHYFVDNFGDRTKDAYITNTDMISGTFSNSATQDSLLNVQFIFKSQSDLSIQLYEYGGNNPVKDGGYANEYDVLVKDKDDKRYELRATNYSDRLTLEDGNARALHGALMKGGRVQFMIRNVRQSSSQYQFMVPNADFYDNAVEKRKNM